uniref:hypothetical protein n=1 Tax=uncultured Bilophila sp. TaxID=529385 RepID=UPI0025FC9974|nr:hypothetical protein [uncultured Bilophila sp.]
MQKNIHKANGAARVHAARRKGVLYAAVPAEEAEMPPFRQQPSVVMVRNGPDGKFR